MDLKGLAGTWLEVRGEVIAGFQWNGNACSIGYINFKEAYSTSD